MHWLPSRPMAVLRHLRKMCDVAYSAPVNRIFRGMMSVRLYLEPAMPAGAYAGPVPSGALKYHSWVCMRL